MSNQVVINPLTGRFIKVGGPTFIKVQHLLKDKCGGQPRMVKYTLGPWNKQWKKKV